ncbi:MAG: methyltransferase [Candidatus Thorarchaeota archaeon]|jgi:SAM-dependent methyltransferase
MSVTKEDVFSILRGYINSAALGSALELGLFWLLDDEPKDAADVARALGIHEMRCEHWLELLRNMSFLDRISEKYVPSSYARTGILETLSKDSWSLLAQEARERLPAVNDLAIHILKPISTWKAQNLSPPNYVSQMEDDPERAHRFTRMLYEIHQPLAEKLAISLDMTDVSRLMDLGGGSGVVTFGLLKQHSHLTAVVVDIANVCAAGQEIAKEESMEKRVTYHSADFVHDNLPKGFDMIIECDVGIYGESLFRKLQDSLNPNGRLVIVDELAQEGNSSHSSHNVRPGYSFLASLDNPDFSFLTVTEVIDQLTRAGYQDISERKTLDNMTIIQALWIGA